MTSRTDTSGTSSSLANRYGARKRALGQRTKTALIGGALAVGVAFAAYAGVSNSATITHKDLSFSIDSATEATVTFQVEKDAAATVQCGVQVLDETYAVVGFTTVTFPATGDSGREAHRETVSVRTEYLGVSGTVESCWELT
ncbi:DUF4307 domain-containing protein [Zhihengliuella flava]|uniref:DUF4307 domain-containing protein n=1 Tax=Zhihengliuella flava TaxID=1285193 RepID=A0A931D5C4_9MICC|nr:DUF4307 domain-containing protein [Zhihengliuella flava]MBG6083995.1 hypothetical protein [Zhihengliuella flava]